MKRNKIVILYKKGQPVFNNTIWYLKGQYAMMLLPIGTKSILHRKAGCERKFQVAEGKKKRSVRSSGLEG